MATTIFNGCQKVETSENVLSPAAISMPSTFLIGKFLGNIATSLFYHLCQVYNPQIFDDNIEYIAELDGKNFSTLPGWAKQNFLNHEISIVEIYDVDKDQELNLLFLRLQMGSILNVGEKLHAMNGFMRDYIFSDLSKHKFFAEINIPHRRYAVEQVAAQIALNYFSVIHEKDFHRSRYTDLQDFFKQYNVKANDTELLTKAINQIIDRIVLCLAGLLGLIRNRATAVSVFLFINNILIQNRDYELDEFAAFFSMFMKTLAWQIPKGIRMDSQYEELLKFQTYVAQAAGEKYAIRRRFDMWVEYFEYYKIEKCIKGDKEYAAETDNNPDIARAPF